jgi:predicted 3-demethylubiquinone-9 3-methyltransferase (glyoxalase superfamily)
MQKISPFLWFDHQAEEAAKFYVSVFKNSKIDKITLCPTEAAKKIGREPGSVLTIEFTLDGVPFVALNCIAPARHRQRSAFPNNNRSPLGCPRRPQTKPLR